MKKDSYVTVCVGITVLMPQDCIVNANGHFVQFDNEEKAKEAMKTLEEFGIKSTIYTRQ